MLKEKKNTLERLVGGAILIAGSANFHMTSYNFMEDPKKTISYLGLLVSAVCFSYGSYYLVKSFQYRD